jgi:SAM-dependent methyltransferase
VVSTRGLQDRAEQLRTGEFLGVPIDGFARGGREQLIVLLMQGLDPHSRVLDLGCGVLRAGYWLIHFLEPRCYFGIEPSAERLAIGTEVILERSTLLAKEPTFDTNATFDSAVFGVRFDYFLAYSIWTHASKRQIETMLDNFLRDSTDEGVFLTPFLPAGLGGADYRGDQWVGTSQESREPGCNRHSFRWIREQCRARALTVEWLGRDTTHGQTWLRIARKHVSDEGERIELIAPSSSELLRAAVRRFSDEYGGYDPRWAEGSSCGVTVASPRARAVPA